jgi:hypothetical protein
VAGAVSGLDRSGLNSYAFVNGLPGDSFVNDAFASHPTVASMFATAGATVLGTAAQGALNSSSRTFDSQVRFTLDTSGLSGDLLVGLLDHASFGHGFDSLTFSIVEQGVTVLSTAFGSLSAAEAFFDDRVLDLGSFTSGSTLDLSFNFELVASSVGNGFGEDFVFGATPGAVPEPSTLSLFSLAALATFALRRHWPGLRDHTRPI